MLLYWSAPVVFVLFHHASAGYNPYFARETKFGEYGGGCEYDDDCLTIHTYCKNNRNCDCKRLYQYDERNDICLPTQLGLKCHNDAECTIPNSRCSESVCECSQGFVPPDGKPANCLPARQLSAVCSDDAQCRVVDSNTHCNVTASRCDCNVGYHNSWTRGNCVANVRLGEGCTKHEECALVADQLDKVECRSDSGSKNKCFCRQGFSKSDGQNICVQGNGSSRVAVLYSLLLTAATVLFYVSK